MSHEVKLDVFEGPIDLLLHLITRRRVDIYEVSLHDITEEYLAAVASRSLDLEAATGFLIVAATLLELKSARLLPQRRIDDDEAQLLEERDLLLARLLECATFREAGTWIAGGLARGALFFGRSAGLEEPYVALVPDLLGRVSKDTLARAAALALQPRPQPVLDTSHVAPIRVSVSDAIVELASALSSGPDASFEDLCSHVDTRIDVVVRFLALLELFKAGAVELSQAERFGAIEASWTGAVDVRQVVAEAEEYAADPEISPQAGGARR